MVRETRYLLVRNLPEKSTEESINQHFQRYGKIQSVKLQPAKDNETTVTATVAFMDIRSASKAHTSKHTIDNAVLRTDYWDATSSTPSRSQGNGSGGGNVGASGGGGGVTAATAAAITTTTTTTTNTTTSNSSSSGSTGFHHGTGAPSSVSRASAGGTNSVAVFPSSWTTTGSGLHRHGSERGNGDVARTQVEFSEKERFDRSRSSPEQSTTSSTRNKKSVSISRSVSRSRSRSPRSRSGSSSSRTYSSESSKSHSKSQSHGSSQGSVRPQSAITLKSTVASEIKDPKADKAKDYDDPHDRRPLGICISGLPTRSSDSSLRDGLFHEYKKHGKVTSVQIIAENGDRYAVVSFRKPEDAVKALEASQGKFFFGTKIKVSSHEGVKVEDGDIRTSETDMDEYHLKATRTLFVGNLEKDTTVQDLLDKFSVFGEIIDVDIKRQGAASAYAFVQYTDIVSVVRALREMEGEHIGANKIKLGFGKSMPTNCVWIDNVAETLHEKFLFRVFRKYGEITYLFIDRSKWRGLVFFTNLDDSQYAVSEMRNRTLRKKKIMIDFASRECQNNFLDKMEKTGQLRPADRPDERGLHKFRQRSFDFQEGFSEENRSRLATTSSQGTPYSRNRSRGRSRNFEEGAYQEDFSSPARRSSRQSSDFSQSSTFFKNVDDYEQELREYGHSQRERRERGSSPRRGGEDSHQSYEDRSHRSSREVSVDRYDGKERQVDIYSVTRSSSPASEHNSYRSERFVTRTVEEKGYRDKYEKDKDDKIVDRLASVDGGDLRGRRSPVFVDGGHGNIAGFDNDMGSFTPPTPTQEEEPVYRTYYVREKDNDPNYTPTYSVIEPKPKLKSVWVNQAVTAVPSSSSSKLVSEVSLPEKSSVRKRVHEESGSNKRKSDQGLSVGSLTLKLTPAERQRQQKTDRKQHRRLGTTKGLNKPIKSDKVRLKGLEGTLSSPGSSGSHPESENGSASEADLLNLQRRKQALLDKLEQLEEGALAGDLGIDDDANSANFGSSLCVSSKSVAVREAIEQGDTASMEELLKTIDSKQSCRKQMEQIARMESRLKEKHREKLNALKANEVRAGGVEVDKPTCSGDSVLDSMLSGPSDTKRRKLGLQDMSGDMPSAVHKHSYCKDISGSVGDAYVDESRTSSKDRDSRSVLLETSSGCDSSLSNRKTSVEAENADSKVSSFSSKEVPKPLKSVSESASVPETFQNRLDSTAGFNTKISTAVPDRDKLKKGVKPFPASSAAGVFLADKRPWSPKFRPSPETEACFSPAVSEDHPDLESNNSESLTEKSSPKPLSPLNDWPQQAPLSSSSKELSDDESSRLGIKPDEPGLLSLMDVDDSLSDTSEDEKSKSGEPSLADRIRMVDEIMQLTTMNKTSDLSLLPSQAVGGSGLSGSASSLSSSLYSKFRIRKRMDADTPGQGCLVPERKSEPSVIVQQLLSKPSILDQDFQRLGQLTIKEESPLPQDIAGRPMMSLHTKAAVKEMPTFPGIGLTHRSLLGIGDNSVITGSSVFHPPATTSASMNLATTTTTTAGQQMVVVTTPSAHHLYQSPALGSLAIPASSPSLGTASPRHPALTNLGYTTMGGVRSPYAAGNGGLQDAVVPSQLLGGEQVSFTANSQERCYLPSALPYSSVQDGQRFPPFENQNLRTAGQTSSAVLPAFSSNHQAADSPGVSVSLEQTLPPVRLDSAWYSNASKSPRIVEPASGGAHSPVAAVSVSTSSISVLPRKETVVTAHSGVSPSFSRPIPGVNKPMDHVRGTELTSSGLPSALSGFLQEQKGQEMDTVSAKNGDKDSASNKHWDGVFQMMEEFEMTRKQPAVTSASLINPSSGLSQSVMSSTPATSSLLSVSLSSSSATIATTTTTTTIFSTSSTPSTFTTPAASAASSTSSKSRSETEKSNKSTKGTNHSKSVDQSARHDPLFAPDIKPEAGAVKLDSKQQLVKEKNGDISDKSSAHSDLSNKDLEVKERKSAHSKTSSSSHPDKKATKSSSKDLSFEKKENERKQDHHSTQKALEKVRHESGSSSKNRSREGEAHRVKESDSHIKNKDSDGGSRSKEIADSHTKVKDTDFSVKNKDGDSHLKSKDKKDVHNRYKEKETDALVKAENKDLETVKSKDNEVSNKSKVKEYHAHGKSADLTEFQVKHKDKDVADLLGKNKEGEAHRKNSEMDSHRSKSKHREDGKKEVSKEATGEMEGKNKMREHSVETETKSKSKEKHDSSKKEKKDKDDSFAKKVSSEKKTAEKIEVNKDDKKGLGKQDEKKVEEKDKKEKKLVDMHEKDKEKDKPKLKDRHENKHEAKPDKYRTENHEAKKERANTTKELKLPADEQKLVTTPSKTASFKSSIETKDCKSNKTKEADKAALIKNPSKNKSKEKEKKEKEDDEKEKEKEKERQKREKEKEKQRKEAKEKKKESESTKSKKKAAEEIDDFPYHMLEEPVYTSMYDTIKRRSCNKVQQVKEVSEDTRKKLTQLKSRRGSTKKSKPSRSILEDSSSDESDQENLSLDSDSQSSDSGSRIEIKPKQSQKQQQQTPAPVKKKRAFVLSSSSDDEDVEEDEEALLRISKAKSKSSQEKKFRQIFDSSSDSDEEIVRKSSPERPASKPKVVAKQQDKKVKSKKQPKKNKSVEDSNDSDSHDLPLPTKITSSAFALTSDISMTEDTNDEVEKMDMEPPKKTKRKKKIDEKQSLKQKKSEEVPAKKQKLSQSKENLSEKKEKQPEKKSKSSEKEKKEKAAPVKEENKISVAEEGNCILLPETKRNQGSNAMTEPGMKEKVVDDEEKNKKNKPKSSENEVQTLEGMMAQTKPKAEKEKTVDKKKKPKVDGHKPVSDKPSSLSMADKEKGLPAVVSKQKVVEEAVVPDVVKEEKSAKASRPEKEKKKPRQKEGKTSKTETESEGGKTTAQKSAASSSVNEVKILPQTTGKQLVAQASGGEAKKDCSKSEKEKKEKKSKKKVQNKTDLHDGASPLQGEEGQRDPILQTLAKDMEREEQQSLKDKMEDKTSEASSENPHTDDASKTQPKKKKKKKVLEKSQPLPAFGLYLPETDQGKAPEPEQEAEAECEPAPEHLEPEDEFVSFWGHPAPVLPKKRDSVPKLEDSREKDDKEKERKQPKDQTNDAGLGGTAVSEDSTHVDGKDTAASSFTATLEESKQKSAWDATVFPQEAAPTPPAASGDASVDQKPKPLIDIPEYAFKVEQDEPAEKSDIDGTMAERSQGAGEKAIKKKTKKKKEKSERKSSKEIDPLAAVESSLVATNALSDETVLLQDVIDKKAVFPDRRYSFEDEILKDSPLLFAETRANRDANPPHLMPSLTVTPKSKMPSLVKLDIEHPSTSKNEPAGSSFSTTEPPEAAAKDSSVPKSEKGETNNIPEIDNAEKAASTITDTLQPAQKQVEDGETTLVPQLDRDELAMQEASDEAARAVQCLLGFEEERQYTYAVGENIQMAGIPPEVTEALNTGASLTSPSAATLLDPTSIQSQPETTESEIPEAAEAPHNSSQADMQEESLSVTEQQEVRAEVETQPEVATETSKKGQRRAKRPNRLKGPKAPSQSEDLSVLSQCQQEMPLSDIKAYSSGEPSAVHTFGETQLPPEPELPRIDGPEVKKNPIDAYDFNAQMDEEDAGLIVESAVSSFHGASQEDQSQIMKSPRRRNNSSRGRGRRARGGTNRETLEKIGKTGQLPQSPATDQQLSAPIQQSSAPVSVPASAPVIPSWQQSIVKDDLASPESKTDLDSSYGEAELVINLEDQATPTSLEDRSGRNQFQFGSDTEDKSPVQQSSASVASPYKSQRSTRTRKPTDYIAMDRGLGMNIPSPRSSRSGSSPRGARGGQSPKTAASRGRGSPKMTEFSSPVVKLEKLEMARGKRRDDATHRGRAGGRESEGIEDVAHTSFEDWKASNMLSTAISAKPVSKENIYEFEDSEQEQKLEPGPMLRLVRGRNKRVSESNEPVTNRSQEPFPGPPAHLHQHAQGTVLGFKDLQEEQAQASDDSSSSMSNVDKIIDAVSKGIFDCGDKNKEPETSTNNVNKSSVAIMGQSGSHGIRNMSKFSIMEHDVKSEPFGISSSLMCKPSTDISVGAVQQGEPSRVDMDTFGHTKACKVKQDVITANHGDLSTNLPHGYPPCFPPGSIQEAGAHGGKPNSLIKQEAIPISTVGWQSVITTTASVTYSKMSPQIVDVSHSQSAISSPGPVQGAAEMSIRSKKGDGIVRQPLEQMTGPSGQHQQPQTRAGLAFARSGLARDETSPLAHMTFFSTMSQSGVPSAVLAEPSRRSGVFAFPVSREQISSVAGQTLAQGGPQEPRYTTSKVSSAPVNVITVGQHGSAVTSGGSIVTQKHGAHGGLSSPTTMPPVPALVQTPHAQSSPKPPPTVAKSWPGGIQPSAGSLTGQQPPINTPPPPQMSPSSSMQPQRPQSVQLPVLTHMDPNPPPVSLRRPPSAHSGQPLLSASRERSGCQPPHPGDMRPPSLPGEVMPSGAGQDRHDREREHLLQLHQMRQGIPPHSFVVVHGGGDPVVIPHSLSPMPPPSPHAQHDMSKLVSSAATMANTSSQINVSAPVTPPMTSHLHGQRRGSLQEQPLSKMAPSSAAGTLFSGVVTSQARSLSPKTASPVGQVIERLPNPLRPIDTLPGAGGPTHAHCVPASPGHPDPNLHLRYHKEDGGLRPVQPPAAHSDSRSHEVLMMQLMEQQQQQLLMSHQVGPARNAAHEVTRAVPCSSGSSRGGPQEMTRNAVAQEIARMSAVQDGSNRTSVVGQEVSRAKEAAGRKEMWGVGGHEPGMGRPGQSMEHSLQEAGLAARAVQDKVPSLSSHRDSQLLGLASASASVQQVPLNLADPDSRSTSSETRGGGSGGSKPSQSPFGMTPGHSFMERSGKTGERPPHESAFMSPVGSGPPSAHREMRPQLYGADMSVFQAPPFAMGVARMQFDPRNIYAPHQHPHQFISNKDAAALAGSFSAFITAGGQRFQLDHHPDAERLMKKAELPPSGSLPTGIALPMVRSPSPIPSPSRGLLNEMISHHHPRIPAVGRYPLVWSGMLALKNDQSHVQMHFVSGSRDLPDQALPHPVISGASLPLRISQRMRLEPPNLEGVTKRMINEKDYTLLLAVPSGQDHLDISEQTKSLTIGFIDYLRSKLAAGIVNVSLPGSQQAAYVVHVFPPCDFSMDVVARHSTGLVEQIHDLAHVIIIITTV